jgi:hypothetical protein
MKGMDRVLDDEDSAPEEAGCRAVHLNGQHGTLL